MTSQNLIENYLLQPFPLWNNEITELIIDEKWTELLQSLFSEKQDYSISGCVLKDSDVKEASFPLDETNGMIQIVLPSEMMFPFYEKHGLIPLQIDRQQDVSEKIQSALRVLKLVPDVHSFILQIVKSMQVIQAENPETDVSYSHPDIPFSIFFSICDQDSLISDFRVAESILHEVLHLQLTLIENILPLIEPNSTQLHYSPWRDEERPLRGVLHGAFVFKGIADFYSLIKTNFLERSEADFLDFRIDEIKKELATIKSFPETKGLTELGKKLSSNLLAY